MNRWRVGTFSMGMTLLLAGAALFASQWQGIEAFDMLMAWWPIALILLGLELIAYLIVGGREKSIVHYDLFSVLFVGILGLGCLAFTFLTSTGVMGEVRQAVASVEHSAPLPETTQAVPAEVSRIVVLTEGIAPRIDQSDLRELHLFGYYRFAAGPKEASALKPSAETKADIRVIGGTMYVKVPALPRKIGFRSVYPEANVTIVVPKDVPVELRGSRGQTIGERNT